MQCVHNFGGKFCGVHHNVLRQAVQVFGIHSEEIPGDLRFTSRRISTMMDDMLDSIGMNMCHHFIIEIIDRTIVRFTGKYNRINP